MKLEVLETTLAIDGLLKLKYKHLYIQKQHLKMDIFRIFLRYCVSVKTEKERKTSCRRVLWSIIHLPYTNTWPIFGESLEGLWKFLAFSLFNIHLAVCRCFRQFSCIGKQESDGCTRYYCCPPPLSLCCVQTVWWYSLSCKASSVTLAAKSMSYVALKI